MQAHKRLVVVASAIGLGAGFFRLILFLSGFHSMSQTQVNCDTVTWINHGLAAVSERPGILYQPDPTVEF